MGFVYDLPFLKDSSQLPGKLLGGWQLNGIYADIFGHAVLHRRHEQCAELPGLRLASSSTSMAIRSRSARWAQAAPRPYYDKSLFSQPTGTRVSRASALRPQPVPPAAGLEPRPLAIQAIQSERADSAGVSRRGRQRLQPHELGRAGDDLHGEQLPAVHSGKRRGRHQYSGRAASTARLSGSVLAGLQLVWGNQTASEPPL